MEKEERIMPLSKVIEEKQKIMAKAPQSNQDITDQSQSNHEQEEAHEKNEGFTMDSKNAKQNSLDTSEKKDAGEKDE